MNIIKKLVKNFSERGSWKPDVIVVHISAGSLTSMTSWFSTPNSQASSHYGIGKDGSILQYVEEDKKAWTQGNVKNPTAEIIIERKDVNPNLYCLSIENEGQDLNDAPKIQWDTLKELIKDIAKRHNIPLDREHIIGHFEIDGVNRTYCPSKNHDIMDKLVSELKDNKLDSIKIKLQELIQLINSL